MAWPASTFTLQTILDSVDGHAVNLKAAGERIATDSAANGSDRDTLLRFAQLLSRAIDYWAFASSVPEIVAFAKTAKRDSEIDVAAEFNAMRTAAISLRDWIVSNVPAPTIGTDGYYTNQTFTVAQTAPLRTRITSFVATID